MIELAHINKTFRVAKRETGAGAALRSLFHREYDLVHALQDVSFRIEDGEMVGYIGPNGAGKSSTIKIMSGILYPDSGECRINGLVPWQDRREHVRNIGVVFGQRSQLWWDVPVTDSFQLIRDIYEVEEPDFRRSLEELTEMLHLEPLLNTPVRQLSLGQRMRCEIAASLLHDPKILFLDEPTIGLDAVSKRAVRDFIRRLNREKGTTVILTTHDMQDIEALTERILLLGSGRILLDGTLQALKSRNSRIRRLNILYNSGHFTLPEGVTLTEEQNGSAVFAVDTEVCSVSRAIEQLSREAEITDLNVSAITAEELVLSLYEEYAL